MSTFLLLLDDASLSLTSSKPAFLAGSLSLTSSKSSYIRGSASITSSKSSYVRGSLTISSSKSLFIRGLGSALDTQDAYIRGLLSTSSNKSLYIEGIDAFVTDSQPLYMRGQDSITDTQPAFTRGAQSILDNQDAYVRGFGIITDNQSAYVRGQDSLLDAQNTFIYGTNPPVIDSNALYIRGAHIRPVASDFQDCFIVVLDGHITDSQRCYIASSSQIRTSLKRSYIVSTSSTTNPYKLRASQRLMIVPASVRAGKNAYITAAASVTTTWDSRIVIDPVTIVTWDTLFLYEGGARTLRRAHVTYPVDEVIETYLDLPTVSAPGIKSVSQEMYIRRYRETTDTQPCHITGVQGTQRSYKTCWIVRATSSATDSNNCYINGGNFVKTGQNSFVYGGGQKYTRGNQLCFINATTDISTASTRSYVASHIALTSLKRCFVPTVQISKGRHNAYIVGV